MARRPRALTAEQKAVVQAVRRIAKQRQRVNSNYVSAILRAREEGVTYAAIAEAAGTSSQAVQEIIRRHSPRRQAEHPSSLSSAGDIAAVASPKVEDDKDNLNGPTLL